MKFLDQAKIYISSGAGGNVLIADVQEEAGTALALGVYSAREGTRVAGRVLDAWLASGPLVFLLWWGACACLTLFTLLFAVYDGLAAVKEEKAKGRD